MDFSLNAFVPQVLANPVLLISVVLTLGVIFVNGWTDAPNAIATCVATRAMSAKAAVMMSAVFNFFGVLVMSLLSPAVADTITKMARFDAAAGDGSIALCAALFAIIVWAVAAWYFGIPTSESHALIAGLTGAALALYNGTGESPVAWEQWGKVGFGLILSTVLGFGLGYLCTKLTVLCFSRTDRRKTRGFFRGGQIFGGAAMSFMHGAQDGLKFMGVLVLVTYLANGTEMGSDTVNVLQYPWMMVLVSVIMALGTSVGGYKIIKSVGMDMVKLEQYQGFSADLAAAACLLVATTTGLPVSTTHTKATSVMGVGASKRLSTINLAVVKEMVMTWVLTFPGCGLIGFLMAKLFLFLF
ncbi:MAG: inorganic phosphate transporter [Clostridia bacterium]|nr:inorganic phosphate transporter [Clostridia bacterium]